MQLIITQAMHKGIKTQMLWKQHCAAECICQTAQIVKSVLALEQWVGAQQ